MSESKVEISKDLARHCREALSRDIAELQKRDKASGITSIGELGRLRMWLKSLEDAIARSGAVDSPDGRQGPATRVV
jgi:hypothetical protein